MRAIIYLALGLLAIVVVLVAVANRHLVEVRTGPDFTQYGLPEMPSAEVPLFLVALGAAFLGFVLGVLREYLRERKHRRTARRRRREVGRLQQKVDALTADQDEDDAIIASSRR